MSDKEIKLAFKRWYEAAREIEPFLSRGISEKDIFYAGYQAGIEGEKVARNTLIDRLVILHIYRKEHDADPVLALKDILDWEIQTALDPQVSSYAAALIQSGRDSMKAEAVKLVADYGASLANGLMIVEAIKELK